MPVEQGAPCPCWSLACWRRVSCKGSGWTDSQRLLPRISDFRTGTPETQFVLMDPVWSSGLSSYPLGFVNPTTPLHPPRCSPGSHKLFVELCRARSWQALVPQASFGVLCSSGLRQSDLLRELCSSPNPVAAGLGVDALGTPPFCPFGSPHHYSLP